MFQGAYMFKLDIYRFNLYIVSTAFDQVLTLRVISVFVIRPLFFFLSSFNRFLVDFNSTFYEIKIGISYSQVHLRSQDWGRTHPRGMGHS